MLKDIYLNAWCDNLVYVHGGNGAMSFNLSGLLVRLADRLLNQKPQ